MHVQLNPLGAMDLLSQLEVDLLKQNANSERYDHNNIKPQQQLSNIFQTDKNLLISPVKKLKQSRSPATKRLAESVKVSCT